MISFKQYLAESRSAPLYHATPISNIFEILTYGLRASTSQDIFQGNRTATKVVYGISTARSIRSSDWYMKHEYKDDDYVVFELDQRAINQKYPFKPVDYFGTEDLKRQAYTKDRNRSPKARQESEEFIVMKIGEYLSPKYIKKIYVFKDKDPYYNEVIKKAKADYPNFQWVAR